jgi:hypothetical protein
VDGGEPATISRYTVSGTGRTLPYRSIAWASTVNATFVAGRSGEPPVRKYAAHPSRVCPGLSIWKFASGPGSFIRAVGFVEPQRDHRTTGIPDRRPVQLTWSVRSRSWPISSTLGAVKGLRGAVSASEGVPGGTRVCESMADSSRLKVVRGVSRTGRTPGRASDVHSDSRARCEDKSRNLRPPGPRRRGSARKAEGRSEDRDQGLRSRISVRTEPQAIRRVGGYPGQEIEDAPRPDAIHRKPRRVTDEAAQRVGGTQPLEPRRGVRFDDGKEHTSQGGATAPPPGSEPRGASATCPPRTHRRG